MKKAFAGECQSQLIVHIELLKNLNKQFTR